MIGYAPLEAMCTTFSVDWPTRAAPEADDGGRLAATAVFDDLFAAEPVRRLWLVRSLNIIGAGRDALRNANALEVSSASDVQAQHAWLYAWLQVEKAQASFHAGCYRDAVDGFSRAAELGAGSFGPAWRLNMLVHRMAAERCYRRVRSADPGSPRLAWQAFILFCSVQLHRLASRFKKERPVVGPDTAGLIRRLASELSPTPGSAGVFSRAAEYLYRRRGDLTGAALSSADVRSDLGEQQMKALGYLIGRVRVQRQACERALVEQRFQDAIRLGEVVIPPARWLRDTPTLAKVHLISWAAAQGLGLVSAARRHERLARRYLTFVQLAHASPDDNPGVLAASLFEPGSTVSAVTRALAQAG